MTEQEQPEKEPEVPDASNGEEAPPEEGQSVEILFPPDPPEENRRPRPAALRLLLILLLGAGVFLLGHLTRPDTLERSMRALGDYWNVVLETGKPWWETAKVKTETFADQLRKRPPDGTVKREGSGSRVQNMKTEAKPSAKPQPSERKIQYWRSPMDPNFVSKKPGKDSMGMKLVPVYEDEVAAGIRISPAMLQNIGVKTTLARSQALSRQIRTVGFLTHDERLEHHIHTKYGGWIDKLYVDFTGQEVKQGDVLMEIYSPDLVSTQEELVLALKYQESMEKSPFPEFRDSATRLVESTIRRLQLFDIPEHQINELIKTRDVKKTMHIHSPTQGVVIKKKAQHGMRVEPGVMLYLIANLSNIWVEAEIYEYELPYIQLGQKAKMQLAYFPGQVFSGEITYIDPLVNPQTRTVKVRLEFPNEKRLLKPNMYADVDLSVSPLKPEVAVPVESVIRSGEAARVILQKTDGSFEYQEVVLGAEAEGLVQVLKGLQEGDRVVTSSNFLIDSESRLKEALGKVGTEMKREASAVKPGGAMERSPEKEIILREAPTAPKMNPGGGHAH
ncbi:MAG: efflux RND transporter periplasmic adaptor subunit [Nitrospina sp.]|nr:efflux RND transporter periplasmic adaptor subunit [Nitrospina sp.]